MASDESVLAYVNAMGFKDEILSHYIDQDLQVTVDRDPGKWTTGNGILHTGIFYTLIHGMRQADLADVCRFSKAIDMATVPYVPGLLNRNPGRPDRQAFDDYWGAAVASWHLNTGHRGDIYWYGRRNWFFYNNVEPGHKQLWAWHARFLGQTALYKICAGEPVNSFDIWALCFKVFANALSGPGNEDAKIKIWLLSTVAENRISVELDDCLAYWKRKMRKAYGNLGGLFRPSYGATHPFSNLTHDF